MQGDLVASILRDMQTIVRRVCRPRRDQMDVNNRPSRPSVSFVDGIAMPVNLQRTIEVRPGLDRSLAIVLHFPAPENHLALFIRGLQLKPDIESVHRATREEVPNLAGAHDDIHASVIAAAHGRVGAINGSGNGTNFTGGAFRQRNIRFFANGESRREFRPSHFAAHRHVGLFFRR